MDRSLHPGTFSTRYKSVSSILCFTGKSGKDKNDTNTRKLLKVEMAPLKGLDPGSGGNSSHGNFPPNAIRLRQTARRKLQVLLVEPVQQGNRREEKRRRFRFLRVVAWISAGLVPY